MFSSLPDRNNLVRWTTFFPGRETQWSPLSSSLSQLLELLAGERSSYLWLPIVASPLACALSLRLTGSVVEGCWAEVYGQVSLQTQIRNSNQSISGAHMKQTQNTPFQQIIPTILTLRTAFTDSGLLNGLVFSPVISFFSSVRVLDSTELTSYQFFTTR